MKTKLIKLLSAWLLARLPWRLLKAVVIEALNTLPPIRRDLVIRGIVAAHKMGHVHKNPRRAS